MRMARKFIPSSWNYEWRQGLANLYRPNNQTSTFTNIRIRGNLNQFFVFNTGFITWNNEF